MLLGKRRIDRFNDQQRGKCNEPRERESEREHRRPTLTINDKLTSSRNGVLVKHTLKNIKKLEPAKSHGVEQRCSRFSAIFDGEIRCCCAHVPKRKKRKKKKISERIV